MAQWDNMNIRECLMFGRRTLRFLMLMCVSCFVSKAIGLADTSSVPGSNLSGFLVPPAKYAPPPPPLRRPRSAANAPPPPLRRPRLAQNAPPPPPWSQFVPPLPRPPPPPSAQSAPPPPPSSPPP